MLRKSLAFILVGAAASSAAYAQMPEPRTGIVSRSVSGIVDIGNSYLGVETEDITKENFAKYGLQEVRGVAIGKVIEGSPAQTAGLQSGDVVVKFNDDEVTSARKLSRLINEVAPDHQARLTVLRNGDSREITVTIGKRQTPGFENRGFSMAFPRPLGRMSDPPVPPMAGVPLYRTYPGDGRDVLIFRNSSGRRIGISVTDLTKQLSSHFGVDGGVLVENVRENSAAAKAGLKAGDIIIEVDGKAVESDFDLIRGIAENKQGSIVLTIVRDRNRQTINVTPEEIKNETNTFFEGFDAPSLPSGGRIAVPPTPAAPGLPVPLNRLYLPRRVL